MHEFKDKPCEIIESEEKQNKRIKKSKSSSPRDLKEAIQWADLRKGSGEYIWKNSCWKRPDAKERNQCLNSGSVFKDSSLSPKGTPHQDSQQSEVKDKERSLKVWEKWLITPGGGLLRLSADFSAKTWQAQGEGGDCSKCWKQQTANQEHIIWQTPILPQWRRNKDLPRQDKSWGASLPLDLP